MSKYLSKSSTRIELSSQEPNDSHTDINSRVNNFCNQAIMWLCKVYDVSRDDVDFEFDYDNSYTKVIMLVIKGQNYNLEVAHNNMDNFWEFRNISDIVNCIVRKFNLKERVIIDNIIHYQVCDLDNKIIFYGYLPYDGKTLIGRYQGIVDRLFIELANYTVNQICDMQIHITTINLRGEIIHQRNTPLKDILFSYLG